MTNVTPSLTGIAAEAAKDASVGILVFAVLLALSLAGCFYYRRSRRQARLSKAWLSAGARTAEVVAIKGSMWVDLSWAISAPDGFGGRQLAVDTALDNLVKGGAGQAVQSMNLMLGLPEREGIDAPAMWP